MADDAGFAKPWADAYARSRAVGLPLFDVDVALTTPSSGAPYVVSARGFSADFGWNAHRRQLVESWRLGLADAAVLGFRAAFAVVGGSFLDCRNDAPRDLDCVVFYDVHASHPDAAALRALQRRMTGAGVDVRFMPGDQSRLFLAKAVGFFMLLYTRKRSADPRAPLLVVLDSETGDPCY